MGGIRAGLGSSRSRGPTPSGQIIVGNDANKLPRCSIVSLFGFFVLATFALRFPIAASRSGNVAGDLCLFGGESYALPWLSCTVSSSSERIVEATHTRPTSQSVMPWHPRGLERGAIAAANLAGQAYKSSASAVAPWMNENKDQNVKVTVIAMMVIFTLGACLGCCLQCALRRLLQPVVQLGRPLQSTRLPAAAPASPPVFLGPTEGPWPLPPVQLAADAGTTTDGSPMPKAAAKAAVRPRAKAKAEVAPKAKAQAKAQPSAATEQEEQASIECPLCRAPMVFKSAMRGGYFYGCTDYPICRGSRRP